MSFVDKVKNLITGADEYDEDFEDEEVEKDDSNESFLHERDHRPERNYESASFERDRRSKVVNINATTQLQVVLVKPESIADGPSIADHLNEKRTVVLNLEDRDDKLCGRIIDFLSGVAYANKGKIKQVAKKTFIITPYNVGITGDILFDQLENSGVYM